jgi:hypothetical protein
MPLKINRNKIEIKTIRLAKRNIINVSKIYSVPAVAMMKKQN